MYKLVCLVGFLWVCYQAIYEVRFHWLHSIVVWYPVYNHIGYSISYNAVAMTEYNTLKAISF